MGQVLALLFALIIEDVLHGLEDVGLSRLAASSRFIIIFVAPLTMILTIIIAVSLIVGICGMAH